MKERETSEAASGQARRRTCSRWRPRARTLRKRVSRSRAKPERRGRCTRRTRRLAPRLGTGDQGRGVSHARGDGVQGGAAVAGTDRRTRARRRDDRCGTARGRRASACDPKPDAMKRGRHSLGADGRRRRSRRRPARRNPRRTHARRTPNSCTSIAATDGAASAGRAWAPARRRRDRRRIRGALRATIRPSYSPPRFPTSSLPLSPTRAPRHDVPRVLVAPSPFLSFPRPVGARFLRPSVRVVGARTATGATRACPRRA